MKETKSKGIQKKIIGKAENRIHVGQQIFIFEFLEKNMNRLIETRLILSCVLCNGFKKNVEEENKRKHLLFAWIMKGGNHKFLRRQKFLHVEITGKCYWNVSKRTISSREFLPDS